jgi:hypothetical protein
MKLRKANTNSKQAIVGRARLAAQSDWHKYEKVEFESNCGRELLVQAFRPTSLRETGFETQN